MARILPPPGRNPPPPTKKALQNHVGLSCGETQKIGNTLYKTAPNSPHRGGRYENQNYDYYNNGQLEKEVKGERHPEGLKGPTRPKMSTVELNIRQARNCENQAKICIDKGQFEDPNLHF